jgi:hypothetical protein
MVNLVVVAKGRRGIKNSTAIPPAMNGGDHHPPDGQREMGKRVNAGGASRHNCVEKAEKALEKLKML